MGGCPGGSAGADEFGLGLLSGVMGDVVGGTRVQPGHLAFVRRSKCLFWRSGSGRGCASITRHPASSAWTPAATNQWVHDHHIQLKQAGQGIVLVPKVVNPDRGVNEDTFHCWPSRLRGMSLISGRVAPNAASRLAACTLTNVLMASRNRSALSIAGSATSRAFSYKASSIVTVVLTPISKRLNRCHCALYRASSRQAPGLLIGGGHAVPPSSIHRSVCSSGISGRNPMSCCSFCG